MSIPDELSAGGGLREWLFFVAAYAGVCFYLPSGTLISCEDNILIFSNLIVRLSLLSLSLLSMGLIIEI